MLKTIKLLIVLTVFYSISKDRLSSDPFISGDGFRSIADHVFDETVRNLDVSKIKNGDVVFVSNCAKQKLERFFLEYHPKIKVKYILITHNGDKSAPREFKKYLEDENLFLWFGQNPDILHHPKFVPIPIGLENRHIGRSHYEYINEILKAPLPERRYLAYANFALHTNPSIRKPVYEYFKNKSFCKLVPTRNSVKEYLSEIRASKYVISPPGNGLDCHRTWEALYLGAVPIVLTSNLDKLFEGLPVIIVSKWADVSATMLFNNYDSILKNNYNLQKLNLSYWKNLIYEFKNTIRSSYGA